MDPAAVKRLAVAALIGLLAACLVFNTNDTSVLLQSARDVLSLHTPYNAANYQFLSPVSVTALYAPLTPLPAEIALRLVAFVSVMLYAYVILREARRWWLAALLMLTPLFLYNVFAVNIDWIVFAALLAPPPLAFLLAMLKPQIGAGVALIALLAVWHKSKPAAMLLLAVEVSIYAASYAMGMRWGYVYAHANFSVFPLGLAVGLPLLGLALRRRDAVLALAAMPFVSPYVGPQSWIVVLPLSAQLLRRGRAALGLFPRPKRAD